MYLVMLQRNCKLLHPTDLCKVENGKENITSDMGDSFEKMLNRHLLAEYFTISITVLVYTFF